MNPVRALAYQPESTPMLPFTPIVFIVDDDVSVRESLEMMIRCQGWQSEIFASAGNFWLTRSLLFQAAWFSTSIFRISTV